MNRAEKAALIAKFEAERNAAETVATSASAPAVKTFDVDGEQIPYSEPTGPVDEKRAETNRWFAEYAKRKED